MKSALVTGPNQIPIYGDFKEPVAQAGQEVIKVTASALSNLTKARASGEHYSSSGQYPLVPGVDGVGLNAKGQRVYFVMPTAPFGALAEKVLVREENCFVLPDGVDDITAAAIANPGMSSMAALTRRASFKSGETVLVNGATGSAGQTAVRIAKYLGAKKIIVTGRDEATLQKLKNFGANVIVPIGDGGDAFENALKEQFGGGIDVILDYLWGASAERILFAGAKAGIEGVPIRFVQIGSMSGSNITLPSAALRSSSFTLMGSGLASVPLKELIAATHEVMRAVVPGQLKIETATAPLADVEKTWNSNFGKSRLVYVVG
ncbi:MAG TPA: zinc-binding alcohol dehydrogenase family protein [bacterium]|jgi:NADPH:quinone reductase-like Zn-dependent oxidoreductase|nr:zinc-binding alcohol dehydrogenase family protein [bacterium]